MPTGLRILRGTGKCVPLTLSGLTISVHSGVSEYFAKAELSDYNLPLRIPSYFHNPLSCVKIIVASIWEVVGMEEQRRYAAIYQRGMISTGWRNH